MLSTKKLLTKICQRLVGGAVEEYTVQVDPTVCNPEFPPKIYKVGRIAMVQFSPFFQYYSSEPQDGVTVATGIPDRFMPIDSNLFFPLGYLDADDYTPNNDWKVPWGLHFVRSQSVNKIFFECASETDLHAISDYFAGAHLVNVPYAIIYITKE